MRQTLIIALLGFVIGGGALLLWQSAVAPPKLPRPDQVQRADVDSATLAEAQGSKLYAFNIPVPQDHYTLNVWVERWTRNDAYPAIYSILTLQSIAKHTDESIQKLTVCFPRIASQHGWIKWDGATSRFDLPNFDIQEIIGTFVLEPRLLVLGQDIPLLAMVIDKQPDQAVVASDNIERRNDVTYYLRARLSAGNHTAPAVWKDGKVQTD